MGNAVSVKEQAHRYAIVAAVKKGPVRDTLHKLRQNVEIRLREQHGQPPLRNHKTHKEVMPVAEVILAGETLYEHTGPGRPGATSVLATLLASDKFVEVLDLSGCAVSARDLAQLAPAVLSSHPRVTRLDLSRNAVSGIGAEGRGRYDPSALLVLCSSLKLNAGMLVSLELSGNRIGPRGAAVLADLLTHHHGLAYLGIEGGDVGDGGKRLLGDALVRKAGAVAAAEASAAEAAAEAAERPEQAVAHGARAMARAAAHKAKLALRERRAREGLRRRFRRAQQRGFEERHRTWLAAGLKWEAEQKAAALAAKAQLSAVERKAMARVEKAAKLAEKRGAKDSAKAAKAAAKAEKAGARAKAKAAKDKAREAKMEAKLAGAERAALGPRPSLSAVKWAVGQEVMVPPLPAAATAEEGAEGAQGAEEGGGDATAAATAAATRLGVVAGVDAKKGELAVEFADGAAQLAVLADEAAAAAAAAAEAAAEVMRGEDGAEGDDPSGLEEEAAQHTLELEEVARQAAARAAEAKQAEDAAAAAGAADGGRRPSSGSFAMALCRPAGWDATVAQWEEDAAELKEHEEGKEGEEEEGGVGREEAVAEADAGEGAEKGDETESEEAKEAAAAAAAAAAATAAAEIAAAAAAAADDEPTPEEMAAKASAKLAAAAAQAAHSRTAMEESRGAEPANKFEEMSDDELDEEMGVGPVGASAAALHLAEMRRPPRPTPAAERQAAAIRAAALTPADAMLEVMKLPGGRWPQLRLLRVDEYDLGRPMPRAHDAHGDGLFHGGGSVGVDGDGDGAAVEELDLFREGLTAADLALLGGVLVGNDSVLSLDLSSNSVCGRFWEPHRDAPTFGEPFQGEYDASGVVNLCAALVAEVLPPPQPPQPKKARPPKERTKAQLKAVAKKRKHMSAEQIKVADAAEARERKEKADEEAADFAAATWQLEEWRRLALQPRFGTLVSLHLSDVRLVSLAYGDHGPPCFAGLDALSAALAVNTSLTFLDVSSNSLAGAWREPELGHDLERVPPLLAAAGVARGNGSTGTGLLGLAHALRLNSTLQTLDLSNNAIALDPRGGQAAANEDGIAAVCEALAIGRPNYDDGEEQRGSVSGLTALNLASNHLKGGAARALGGALPYSALRVLDASENRLGCSEAALRALGEGIAAASALEVLDITSNLLDLDEVDDPPEGHPRYGNPGGRFVFCATLAASATLHELNGRVVGSLQEQRDALQEEQKDAQRQLLQLQLEEEGWNDGSLAMPDSLGTPDEEQVVQRRCNVLEQVMLASEEAHARGELPQ